MAPLQQSLPPTKKMQPPQVEIEPYGADWHKTPAKKASTQSVAGSEAQEENKADTNIQYFYSDEYKNGQRRTDHRVIKKVRFSLGNLRIQTVYSPSNQFHFPTKKELQEWSVLRPRKRNYMEEKSPLKPTTSSKKKKKTRKKKKKGEDFTPDKVGQGLNNKEQKYGTENENVDELLGEERKVNIAFNDCNMGFLLQPVSGRYKAMVAQVTRHLMENEKLYPGMRVCSIENNPIPPSCSFADVQAMMEQLRVPTVIGFVDVYKNRCKICLRGFQKYDQLALHMAEHKQHQPPQVEQLDQRKRWLMNLQMTNPLMYQQYVVQHQIGRLQAHIDTIRSNPSLQSQLSQAEAHMEMLKSQLVSLSHQQHAMMLQKQQSSILRGEGQALPAQGSIETGTCTDAAVAANAGRPEDVQMPNILRSADTSSSAQQLQGNPELVNSATGPQNTSMANSEGQPTNKEESREDKNIQIALSQLAALKQIYTRSPQTAIAQLAGLLQMAEKNEVAVSQLRNLQEAAKRDAELACMFSNLQKTAFSVLQRHIARQQVSKDIAPQVHDASQLQVPRTNEQKPKKT